MSNLARIADVADDGPWCGTKPPGWHPPRPRVDLEPLLGDFNRAAGPQPQPWRSASTIAVISQSLRLFQLGKQLKEIGSQNTNLLRLGNALTAVADEWFDGQCGSIPISVIIAWILTHPVPPPPPWLETIISAVNNIELGSKIGGELGNQIETHAAGIVRERLPIKD